MFAPWRHDVNPVRFTSTKADMSFELDLRNLHRELVGAEIFRDLLPEDLVKLPEKGLAHDHVRIATHRREGRALLVRVPRLSQVGLAPEANLEHQRSCFLRAAPSGHTPRLHGTVAPSARLPLGALIVDAIDGVPPRLPGDLGALAEALASVHRLRLPASAECAPLRLVTDPVAALVELIEQQADHIPALVHDAGARAMLEEERRWARDFARRKTSLIQPVSLVLTDTHPGNFIVEPSGSAFFVDLEKAMYASPAVDLAHATLYTSTTWDPDVDASLTHDEIVGFYEAYMIAVPPSLGRSLEPWLLPMRRLTWLRTTTWGCRWFAEHAASVEAAGAGGRAALLRGVLERLRRMALPETMERVRSEWIGPHRLQLD